MTPPVHSEVFSSIVDMLPGGAFSGYLPYSCLLLVAVIVLVRCCVSCMVESVDPISTTVATSVRNSLMVSSSCCFRLLVGNRSVGLLWLFPVQSLTSDPLLIRFKNSTPAVVSFSRLTMALVVPGSLVVAPVANRHHSPLRSVLVVVDRSVGVPLLTSIDCCLWRLTPVVVPVIPDFRAYLLFNSFGPLLHFVAGNSCLLHFGIPRTPMFSYCDASLHVLVRNFIPVMHRLPVPVALLQFALRIVSPFTPADAPQFQSRSSSLLRPSSAVVAAGTLHLIVVCSGVYRCCHRY
jgi:hypothetical protein